MKKGTLGSVWLALLMICGPRAQAFDAPERAFAHFYFVANPARSPRVREPHLYSKTMRRLPSPLVIPVYRDGGSQDWMIRDEDCSPQPLPLDSSYTAHCFRYSGWRGQLSDEGGMEWLPDILPAKHLRFKVLATDQSDSTYGPRLLERSEADLLKIESDHALVERIQSLTSELLKQDLGSRFNFDTGHCYVLAALIRQRLQEHWPELRVRYVHLWVPTAVNSDQGLRLKTHPERRSFPGRQQETPVAFRYHTALLVEGLKQLWIVDPTASDRVVDFESWRTLFTSGGSTELAAIQVEFRDQVHFQLDLSAHLSIQLLKAERLVALGTSRLDATDWVSLTDLGPTSVWPTYIIHGHSASGSPDRVDFAPRQTQIKR